MVNLEWYRTFKAIYEEGTLTAAAQRMFVSQPGVSLHLSSLETYVGEKLFRRISKRMLPTEKGKLLYNAIDDPLKALERVEAQFQRTVTPEVPTISLGMCFETFQLKLERHLHELDFNVVTRFSGYKELESDLINGAVDVIVTPHKSEHKTLAYLPIMEEYIVLVGSTTVDDAPLQLLLAQQQWQQAKEFLLQHTWYGAASDNEHFTRFWQNNFGERPSFRQNFIVPNFTSIVRSLSYGKGVAIVPDFLAANAIRSGEVKVLWKGKQPTANQIYLAYRKKSMYTQMIDAIYKVLLAEE